MASPEQIALSLPETLPEDFSDWDSEASPMPVLGNSGERESSEDAHSFGETLKPLGQSADHDAILESLLGEPRTSVFASPAPASKQQRDFIDWENKESPPAPPANRSEWESWEAGRSIGKSPKPLGRSADPAAILESLLVRPRVSGSASPAPVSLRPKKLESELADVSPSASRTPERKPSNSAHLEGVQGGSLSMKKPPEGRASGYTGSDYAVDAGPTTNDAPVVQTLPNAASVAGMSHSPELAATLRREADEVLFQTFRSKNIDVKGERTTAGHKRVTASALGACGIALLLVLLAPLLHHGTKPATKQSVHPSAGAFPQMKTNSPVPPASQPLTQVAPSATEPLTQVEPPATTQRQQTTDNPPANEAKRVNPAQAQTNMMNDQLSAPIRIPQEIKKQIAANGPPPASFGDGLRGNGAIDGAFNGHAQPPIKVAPSKPLPISSGVAAGMLMLHQLPVYPPIAKAAHVSGTVALNAIISKDGTIKDLHVVSGPAMLRQAAVDAVRTWRYKPFKLNNEPTEVETTISVVFSLGG